MKSLRLFSLIGLIAFAFLAMAPPASAGTSFGIDNVDMVYSAAQPAQLGSIDNEWKPIIIVDGGSAIVDTDNGFIGPWRCVFDSQKEISMPDFMK